MSGFVAVDWGTTNRRIHRVEDGRLIETVRDDRGVRTMAGRDYADELAAIRARFGDGPVLLAGMVGSTIGWRAVAYVPAPAGIDDIAAGLDPVGEAAWIVPGVSQGHPADVMRGEEVQFLGAVAGGLAPPDALLCQPGTHAKWATMAGGRIAGFTSALTGELFAILKGHSVLATQLTGPVDDDDAFEGGVREGARGDLLAALFRVRAESLVGTRPDRHAASHASGLLIGADIAARDVGGRDVHLLAEAPLDALYARAIATLGGRPVVLSATDAFVAGAAAIMEMRR